MHMELSTGVSLLATHLDRLCQGGDCEDRGPLTLAISAPRASLSLPLHSQRNSRESSLLLGPVGVCVLF